MMPESGWPGSGLTTSENGASGDQVIPPSLDFADHILEQGMVSSPLTHVAVASRSSYQTATKRLLESIDRFGCQLALVEVSVVFNFVSVPKVAPLSVERMT